MHLIKLPLLKTHELIHYLIWLPKSKPVSTHTYITCHHSTTTIVLLLCLWTFYLLTYPGYQIWYKLCNNTRSKNYVFNQRTRPIKSTHSMYRFHFYRTSWRFLNMEWNNKQKRFLFYLEHCNKRVSMWRALPNPTCYLC